MILSMTGKGAGAAEIGRVLGRTGPTFNQRHVHMIEYE